MADEIPEEIPQPTTAEPALKTVADFWTSVRAGIDERSAVVEETVIEHFAKKEVNVRIDKTIAAIDALKLAEADLKKIKPDLVTYDAEGKETTSGYSKTVAETRKKAREKVERIEAALSDVFNKNNFDKLLKLQGEKAEKDAAA